MRVDPLHIAGLACALLALPGCKVGPDFSRPASSVAAHWISEPPEAATGSAGTADWWRVFHDPTLDALAHLCNHLICVYLAMAPVRAIFFCNCRMP